MWIEWRRVRTILARWLDQREVSNSAITFASAVLVGIGKQLAG